MKVFVELPPFCLLLETVRSLLTKWRAFLYFYKTYKRPKRSVIKRLAVYYYPRSKTAGRFQVEIESLYILQTSQHGQYLMI